MSSQAIASNNSERESSGNSPFHLLHRVESSDLHPRLRTVLMAMLREFNRFAVLGTSNELYPAQLTVAIATGLPYITIRRAIDRLVEKEVLVQVYGSNATVKKGAGYEFRRPCTYQVNLVKLSPRTTVKQFTRMRDSGRVSRPFRPQSVTTAQRSTHHGERPAPTPIQTPPVPPRESCRTIQSPRSTPPLTSRQRAELVSRIPRFMKGCHGSVAGPSGEALWVGPDHPHYRPSMSKPDAILAACKTMCETHGISLERAIEAAADAGFRIEPPEKSVESQGLSET